MVNRYTQQQLLPEIGTAGQEKLANSKILVVGGGGLAASILPYLTAAGVGFITIIDYDSVNITNLNRQILFKEKDVGLNKAEILKNRLEKQNSTIKVEVITDKFDLNNGIKLTASHDLVIDCTDNYPTKVSISYCCTRSKTPLVYGSVLGWDGQVALLAMQSKADPCYKCFQKLAPQSAMSCSLGGVLGASVNIVGSHQAALAIQYLLGKLHNLNFLFVFDLWNLEQKKFKLHRRQNCKFHEDHGYDSLNYIEFHKLNKLGNYILIDIRTEEEWEASHIPGAKHYNPGKLIHANHEYTKADNLVLYCNHETLSQLVVENLQNLGLKAYVLKGGYQEYAKNFKANSDY